MATTPRGLYWLCCGGCSDDSISLLNTEWPDIVKLPYPPNAPPWRTFWLMVHADNALQVIIDGLSLACLTNWTDGAVADD